MITLGVIADTHVPDRAPELESEILPIFEKARVKAILHAGDISAPTVLQQLGQIAPVFAVRGNRDWFMLRHLPDTRYLEFDGVPIVLTHGYGVWWAYLIDKLQFLREGYRKERYQTRLQKAFPQARVVVFGHTHYSLNLWTNDQLLFNPGSAHFPGDKKETPSLGLLHIEAGGRVKSELIHLRPTFTRPVQR